MRSTTVLSSLAAVFFAGLATHVAAQDGNCQVSDLDEFEFMHSPAAGFLIYWTHPTDEISFMVEAESEEWLAVGFSSDGMMVGSDAVIFLPESQDVSEHILGSKSVSDIMPSDETELTDTSFLQDGGDTIFWFTRNTTPKDTTTDKLTIPNTPNIPINIIWAKGMDNGFGYHGQGNRGSFIVDLFCPSADTPAPTEATTPSPVATTPAPVVEATEAPVVAVAPTMEPTLMVADETPSTAPVDPTTASFTLPPGGRIAETAPPEETEDTSEGAESPTATPVDPTTEAPAAAPLASVEPVDDAPTAAEASEESVTEAPAAAPVESDESATEAPAAADPVGSGESITEAPVAGSRGLGSPAPTAVMAAVPTDSPIALSASSEEDATRAPIGDESSTSEEASEETTEEEGMAGTPSPASAEEGIVGTPVEGAGFAPTRSPGGYVGAAARVGGGGVQGAAVATALAAVSLGVFWARGL